MARKDRSLPSIAEVTKNLRHARENATAEQVTDGREWYPSTYILAAELANDAFDATGDPISPEFAAGTIACFSQNSTWVANITMAQNYLMGEGAGMGSVLGELERMEEGMDPADAMGALKRPDFYRNIIGDHNVVTCDRWHLRAAFRLDQVDASNPESMPGYVQRTRTKKTAPWKPCVKLTPEVHALVTEATRTVAAEFGESPAECQAVIWCAIRGDGR